ncbi:pilus assembly protein [Terrabacter terrae]|uniref:Pilus assembly protein n=1 Tax=Terrabacter terrae TaxID=318434 RepID=A0ABN2TS72_9MICO
MARREHGASAVEFAIVFPVLFLLLAAIVDFGRAYFYQAQLTNAAREGVRAAVVSSLTAAEIKARAAASVPGLASASLTYPVLDQCPSASGNAKMTVTAPFEWIVLKPAISIIGGSWGMGNTLSSTAVMKCGG